tara:strand:- start:125 stop:646 length:522 start_codon:yes stop_codon:yes gene_type:complete
MSVNMNNDDVNRHNDLEEEDQNTIKIKLSPVVVRLLSCAAQGYVALFSTSFFADEIAASDDPEEYPDVLKKLLTFEESAIGRMRAWFSPDKFDKLLDSDNHREVCLAITAMDEFDISLKMALLEVDALDRNTADEMIRCIYDEIYEICYWGKKEKEDAEKENKEPPPSTASTE